MCVLHFLYNKPPGHIGNECAVTVKVKAPRDWAPWGGRERRHFTRRADLFAGPSGSKLNSETMSCPCCALSPSSPRTETMSRVLSHLITGLCARSRHAGRPLRHLTPLRIKWGDHVSPASVSGGRMSKSPEYYETNKKKQQKKNATVLLQTGGRGTADDVSSWHVTIYFRYSRAHSGAFQDTLWLHVSTLTLTLTLVKSFYLKILILSNHTGKKNSATQNAFILPLAKKTTWCNAILLMYGSGSLYTGYFLCCESLFQRGILSGREEVKGEFILIQKSEHNFPREQIVFCINCQGDLTRRVEFLMKTLTLDSTLVANLLKTAPSGLQWPKQSSALNCHKLFSIYFY